MKYFSLKGVKDAYKQISTTTKDKFWGILGILYSIDCTIEPCKTYNINTPKLADFLEGTFRLSNKKTYETSNSVYSVVFANNWEDKVAEHFLVGKPDIMPIIVWAYRNTRFETELNANELFERFVCDFHISKESIRSLFSIRLENYQLEYGDAKYRDDDLLRELRGSISTDATTIKMNNQFVVANAGDLSRGPFFQPLYASLNTLECLIIFPFDTTDYYNVFKPNKVNHTSCTNVDTGQIIYYGCPGSGKSHYVNFITENVDSNFVFRTTFHPDTDYASFVGCYKPTTVHRDMPLLTLEELQAEFKKIDFASDKVRKRIEFATKYAESFINLAIKNNVSYNKIINQVYNPDSSSLDTYYAIFIEQIVNERAKVDIGISYQFIPQVFTNAYVQAWKNPEEKVYLIIEEINRGNCAQIFGDLFQLLDRKSGVSEYPVKADKDLADYLRSTLGVDHKGIKNGELCLPPNLIIWATMNTSDQSLFPMDSAFKRRWEWEYVPIEYGVAKESYNYIITIGEKKYRWVDFLKIVNEKIYDTTRSEDKQMGNFFIKKSIDSKEFVNKVMFYLWNEVCKEEYGTTRNFFRYEDSGSNDGKEFKFVDLFDKDTGDNLLTSFMNYLKVKEYTE